MRLLRGKCDAGAGSESGDFLGEIAYILCVI